MSKPSFFKSDLFRIIAIIVVSSIGIFRILHSNISGSAILYIGIPAAIGAFLLISTKETAEKDWKSRLARFSRYSLIIMLGSSVILLEGFLCVVMFMPIYFLVIFIVFLIKQAYEKNKGRSNMHLHILPLILIVSASEGIHPSLSFDRYNEVTSSKVVNVSIDQIKRNLVRPVELEQSRNWLLTLFPMPYQTEIGPLNEGEIHTIHYRYHRWFVTNTHEGYTKMKVAEVSDNRIRLEMLEDTSYLSNYLKAHGTEINMKALDSGRTEVKLTIKYDRLLDPAWYFDPLQAYATKQLGTYLIETMIE